jgi:hypothetical protein
MALGLDGVRYAFDIYILNSEIKNGAIWVRYAFQMYVLDSENANEAILTRLDPIMISI